MTIKIVRRIELGGTSGFDATLESDACEFETIEEALAAIAEDAAGGFEPVNKSAIRRVEYVFDQGDARHD